MAEIVNLSVFTNDGVSSSNADLLQQAFQDVVEDEERDNQFVAFFKGEDGEQQTIRLTEDQAAALGLTFEVDSFVEAKPEEIDYPRVRDTILDDIQSVTSKMKPQEEQHGIGQVQFSTGSEWIQDSGDPGTNVQSDQVISQVGDFEDANQNRTLRAYLLQNLRVLSKKLNTEVAASHHQDAPTIQRLPVIIPQSQFIIKPAQTILKPGRSIRLVSSTNGMPMSAVTGSTISQNSLLIQKPNLVNGLNSHMVKNTPVTTQLINGNPVPIGNRTNGQVRLSPFVKSPGHGPRANHQQFYTTVSKTPEPLGNLKSQVPSSKNAVTGSLIKPAPVPQIVRTTGASVVKTAAGQAKAANSQIIFKTTPRLKMQDLKTVMNNGTTVRPPTQLSSTPVSILKPQTKVAFTNSNKQNMISQTKLVKKVSISPQRPTDTKIVRNSSNLVNPHYAQNNEMRPIDSNGVGVAKVVKKIPQAEQQNSPTSAVQGDSSRVLSNSDNPIQIVQQGQTFHSMQKLTPSQLKQIAHVLQQRGSQESAGSKEKVVYRLVFPDELDLKTRNPHNLIKGGRGKRGRPKKAPVRHVAAVSKSGMTDEETEESKEDRKKVVARTRSGRLSRPPRHMVRDYKHLHPLDFMQPDLDDSDGGYSDYNTNTLLNGKIDGEEHNKELLTGLELPKRKVSTHFRCSTCNKIYLGRARMAKHFELFPEHGSLEPLPTSTLTANDCVDGELKKSAPLIDSFKRKGKKRGPWAYVTPEAKSERRQTKLREALSVCDSGEISKIAAKPVLNAQSLYDLMAIKSDNNVRVFLKELKIFMEKIREQAGIMLSPIAEKNKEEGNFVEIMDELLCDALGLVPGTYSVNDEVFKKPDPYPSANVAASEEPPLKLQKIRNDEGKENIEERLSSGFSESSDLSASDFLTERKLDPNCPEVLTALTLMPRNPSPVSEANKNNVSKLLISSAQIQKQISETPGFQKVDISTSKSPTSRKIETIKDGFTKLTDRLDISTCSPVFGKLDSNFQQSKMEPSSQAFIKLEPMQQNFIKLDNGATDTFEKGQSHDLSKLENGFDSLTDSTQNFAKGFQKLISKMNSDMEDLKPEELNGEKNVCKISDSLPMLQDPVPIMTTNCDGGIFGSADNLDQIGHLDYTGVMDKHLMMDEKLVEHLHLVDQSNLVDDLVSERLKNMMPDNILENNLMPNNANLDTELDFDALTEEFNRNTRS